MTSSLYFLPPTSSPPWLLTSSKINSVAPLWGMPQGAAGPESGVATPHLMTSPAPALPGPTASTTAAKTVTQARGEYGFIVVPSYSGRTRTYARVDRTIRYGSIAGQYCGGRRKPQNLRRDSRIAVSVAGPQRPPGLR